MPHSARPIARAAISAARSGRSSGPHSISGCFANRSRRPAARRLDEIAAAAGKSAQRRAPSLCEQILGACVDPLEATYVIKI